MHASQIILIAIATSVVSTGSFVHLTQRLERFEETSETGVLVPDLSALSEEDARTNLMTTGLIPELGPPTVTESVEPETVAKQVPVAGYSAKKGSTVTISLAAVLVEVPSVLDRSEDQARLALTEVGFEPELGTSTPHPTASSGSVVAQTPAPGGRVPKGSKVQLHLSSGPPKIVVPPLTGMTEASAQKKLEEAGLALGTVRWVSNPKHAPHAIVLQEPEAETELERGQAVSIFVNRK